MSLYELNELVDTYLGIYYEETKILIVDCSLQSGGYDNVTVMGSWDNWAREYPVYTLTFQNGYLHYIYIPETPREWEHQYKYKRNGAWMEPGSEDERAQDSHGNWNLIMDVYIRREDSPKDSRLERMEQTLIQALNGIDALEARIMTSHQEEIIDVVGTVSKFKQAYAAALKRSDTQCRWMFKKELDCSVCITPGCHVHTKVGC